MKIKKLFENIAEIIKENGEWGKGNIEGTYNIPYNFQWLAKLGFILLVIAIMPFVLVFWLSEQLCKGIVKFMPVIGNVFGRLKKQAYPFVRWCAVKFALLRVWLNARTPHKDNSFMKWCWILLLLIFLLPFGYYLFKCCNQPKAEMPEQVALFDMYDISIDKVVVARAYLDGVQTEVTNDRVLIGLKYINGAPLEPLKGTDFNGFAYDQAILHVIEDWKPVVVENVNPNLMLDDQQMTVITLTAMRMGPEGFSRSTFCKKLNEGDFEGASKWLCLQKPDGSLRSMGKEASLYFFVLKMLWTKQLSIDELADLPMFSYKRLSVDDAKSDTLTVDIREKLRHGSYKTPREALKL